MTLLRTLIADRRGVVATEYAIIALLLGTGLIASLQGLGGEVDSSFTALESHMAEANG